MALCMYLTKHSWPQGRKGNNYDGYVMPIGYLNTALTGGFCDNPSKPMGSDLKIELLTGRPDIG